MWSKYDTEQISKNQGEHGLGGSDADADNDNYYEDISHHNHANYVDDSVVDLLIIVRMMMIMVLIKVFCYTYNSAYSNTATVII